jgi:YD repeat-containing protein
MNSKGIAVVIGLILLVCAWSVGAFGQQCRTTFVCSSTQIGCLPIPPATAYGGVWNGPWSWSYWVNLFNCAPPSECPSCNRAAHPIDLATGDTYITEVDVKIPGLGGGLTLTRTWNSIAFEGSSRLGMFGQNWTSNFDENLFVGGDGYMKYAKADGGFWSLGFNGWDGNGNPLFVVAGSAGVGATLTQGQTNWTLVFQNGEQRVFDRTSGKLLSITDRNGNTTQLTYDSSFRLITVIDPAGRHLYFSYPAGANYFVTSVTSDVGVSLSYVYDSLGRLAQYTKPDATIVSFQYNAPNPNLLTAVLDANGKVLESHTYNTCGQGLTSSRAGGVESITVSYPLPCHLGPTAAP